MAEQVARAGKSNAKHLSQEISEALRERRWTEASTLLADLSKQTATNVKLGSLQRWTRDADASVDDDKAQWRALLWLLCRVAAGDAAAQVVHHDAAAARRQHQRMAAAEPKLSAISTADQSPFSAESKALRSSSASDRASAADSS